MSRSLLLAATLLLSNIISAASPQENWWAAGNQFYRQKQYDSAAVYFEKIATQKPHEAAVYYNLGNTYYRLNQVGAAVLNYERALKADPKHKEAKDNLMLTQSRIHNRIPEVQDIFFLRWWQSLTSASSTTIWSVLSLMFFLAMIGLSLMKVLGKVERPTGRLRIGLGAVWVLCMILALVAAGRHNTERGVVMQDGSSLMSAERNGKLVLPVPEGTTVDIESETATMVEVRLPDSRKGWLDKSAISRI